MACYDSLMDVISASSRLPFLNPELHAMAFSVVGDHQQAQAMVERALSAYAIYHQELAFDEHPWTISIVDLSQWTPRHRLQLMEQLWQVLKREKCMSGSGFNALGLTERVALYLRARTPLELEEIASLLQLSTSDTVALLERARRDLLEREAPGLLLEPSKLDCRHSNKAEALAALDVERFEDDFLIRHMKECQQCTERYSEAKKRRDAWLAFIPEGTIPRQMQREFEQQLPSMLKQVLPKNSKSASAIARRVGKGSVAAGSDLLSTLLKPTFVITVAGVLLVTLAVWASR